MPGPLLGRDPPPRFNSCQRQPPLSDHSVFAFWLVAYERFDCNNFSIVENSFHPDYRRCLLHIALLPSADISNRQSFISIDDPRPRFSDSAFKPAYSMMWRPRASRDVNAYCYLQRIQLYLSRSSAKSLIHAFVASRVDYCNNLLCGSPKYQLSKLQRVIFFRTACQFGVPGGTYPPKCPPPGGLNASVRAISRLCFSSYIGYLFAPLLNTKYYSLKLNVLHDMTPDYLR